MAYHLQRFPDAQQRDYARALQEIRTGRKRSHWIWYIFPQLAGLGYSEYCRIYGIRGISEAKAYMDHPVLGNRLIEISEALLALDESDPAAVMGKPDDLKLRSCMTLFAIASPEQDVFERVLKKYYNGIRDHVTEQMIKEEEKKS